MTATKSVLETLEAARKLIELPEHWIQGQFARDAKGERIPWFLIPQCPTDGSFCALGAMWRAREADYTDEDVEALVAVMQGARNVDEFNDTHTHAEVLAAFDAAIAKEKEAQHA